MSGQSSRQMVVDEMFPDGPGNLDYVDAEDGVSFSAFFCCVSAVYQVSRSVPDPDWIRIKSGQWIRIRTQEGQIDPLK
jgi:hypothetical protein